MPHGQATLAKLPPAERQAPAPAQQTLYEYVDAMCDALKDAGLQPNDPWAAGEQGAELQARECRSCGDPVLMFSSY
jgi:hypothetical protein